MFKTIMCPLGAQCPDHTKDRWPKSNLPTTTQVGYKCPYAHHPNELLFPQTIKAKIAALESMETKLSGVEKKNK